jgi:predicted porin
VLPQPFQESIMKASQFAVSLLATSAIGVSLSPALAQSNVQIYGLLDIGIDRVSNVAGKSLTAQNAGILAPNLMGFKGAEDLGGGTKATFNLETQFSMDTGSTVGNYFGRKASVGLTGELGSVTMGVLNDFMFTNLGPKRYGPAFPFVEIRYLRQGPYQSLTPFGSFDFDRIAASSRVNNAVRYDSPNLNGFSFGALYGLGESSSSTSQNRSVSVGADYATGPWTVNFAATSVHYASINNGMDGVDTWGLGGRRDFEDGSALDALFTSTKNTFTGGKVNVVEVGYLLPIAPKYGLMTQYTHMKGNDTVGGATTNQLNMGLHYMLSKRTRVYTSFAYQKVSGGDGSATAQLVLAGDASDSKSQNILRVGVFHAF